MCFGGGNDTPSQPVNPAPYPYAELDVKDSRAPTPHGNESGAPTTPASQSDKTATSPSSGANYNNIGM